MNYSIKRYKPGDDVSACMDAILNEVYNPEQKNARPVLKPNEPHLIDTLVLFSGEKPVGISCCYLNPGISYQGSVPLLTGHFECPDQAEGAQKLFQAVEAVALEKGCRHIIGPMNGSTYDAHRLMLSLEQPLFFTEHYNPLYYNNLFTASNYQIISRYTSHSAPVVVEDSPEPGYLKNQLNDAGIVIRPMRSDDFEAELKRIYPLCMQAFSHNFLYAPIDEGEFLARYLPLAAILDPDFALVAEDTTGTPLAFMLCLPDLLQTAKKQLIVKTIARHPGLPLKGLITAIGDEIYRRAAAQGYETIIHAFIHESNRSGRVSMRFGGKLYREYALYGKEMAAS